MDVSKVNYEFIFFEIRGNARGIINEKREKSIHLSIDGTNLWGFSPCAHCWLTRLDLKLPR